MEQFRQVGEALGSINALMTFHEELRINPRQCRLLADAYGLAFQAVAEEARAHLRFDERLAKWKALEGPLRELHRVFRDGEHYIRQCLEPREWWARAAALSPGTDCVDHHVHALLWCLPVVLEAIESVGEITGNDEEEIGRRRLLFAKKYDKEWLDPKLFQHKLGKLYMVTQELCGRMDTAWKEDQWLLSEALAEKRRSSAGLTKHEHRLAELLVAPRGQLHPASVMLSDFQVRRRLGGRLKEVHWMGESFAVRHVIGDVEQLGPEIALLSSVAHPNVAHYTYCFHDEERKESFLVMDQLMSKDLAGYIKEVSCPRRRIPFPLVVAVDIMLQIARGMEYLHARKVCHGDLNPSNVLVRPRSSCPDGGYLHVKIAGFGQSPSAVKAGSRKEADTANASDNACIWYAPEVLELELEHVAAGRCTEKADVYSFAMICFELLTGKIPFEDNHLQGDKTSKNIRAGERPLFPFHSPKYLTGLTKRCWAADPAQRPGFAAICRVLRYIKRFLVMNPDNGQADAVVPPVDYFDIETMLSRKFPAWQSGEAGRVSDVPFQMYAYRVIERERTSVNIKEKSSDSGSEGTSLNGENGFGAMLPDDTFSMSNRTVRSLPDSSSKRASAKKSDGKATRQPGTPQKSKSLNLNMRPPQTSRRTQRIKSEGQLQSAAILPERRRTSSGHASDSELA